MFARVDNDELMTSMMVEEKENLPFKVSFYLAVVPFSSQYLDEDGHMAHEFYEEVWIAPNKWVMKQIAPAVLRPVVRSRYVSTPLVSDISFQYTGI